MTAIIGSILILYLLFLKIKTDVDILNPMILFALIVLSTYFISTLKLSGLQHEYPMWFSLLILLLILTFLIGAKLAAILRWKQKKRDIRYDSSTLRLLAFFIWIGIVISFAIEIVILGPPPAISGSIRNQYFVSGIGSIVTLQSVFWGLIIYDRYNQKSLGKFFWLYVISVVIIAGLLSNKYQIIYMGIILLIAHNTFKKRIQIKTLAFFSFLVLLLFLALFEFVYQDMYNITFDKISEIYQMDLPDSLNVLAQPYLYVAFNYENLYTFLISDHSNLYGLATFNGLFKFFSLNQFYSSETQLIMEQRDAALNIDAMNTGTMFEDFAQDGDAFVFLFTFLAGFWAYLSYKNFKLNHSFFSFYMFITTTSSVFMAFFVNAFTSKLTLVNLLGAYFIGLVLHRVIVSRHRKTVEYKDL